MASRLQLKQILLTRLAQQQAGRSRRRAHVLTCHLSGALADSHSTRGFHGPAGDLYFMSLNCEKNWWKRDMSRKCWIVKMYERAGIWSGDHLVSSATLSIPYCFAGTITSSRNRASSSSKWHPKDVRNILLFLCTVHGPMANLKWWVFIEPSKS